MENLTGLTDEELEMLKQSNIDSFISTQKSLNKITSETFERQNKFNKQTTELEKALSKRIELQDKRIKNLYKTMVIYGLGMIVYIVCQTLSEMM